MIQDLVQLIQKHSSAVKLIALITGVAIVIWSIAGVDASHAHSWMEKHVPGFWSLFALAACIILIFFVKWFSNCGIQREEDYYDN